MLLLVVSRVMPVARTFFVTLTVQVALKEPSTVVAVIFAEPVSLAVSLPDDETATT